MKIVKHINGADFIGHRLNIILDTNELYLGLVNGNEACPAVAVAWLSHGTDVNDGLGCGVEIEMVVQFPGAVEIGVGQEDAGKMGMSDEAKTVHTLEVAGELVDIRVNVVREDILVDWSAGRGMDKAHFIRGYLDGYRAQEAGACSAALGLGVTEQFATSPEAGLLGAEIEVGGLVEDCKIMIAHDGLLTVFGDQVEALEGIGPVADNIAKADDSADVELFNAFEDGLEGLEVAVDVGNDRKHALPAGLEVQNTSDQQAE